MTLIDTSSFSFVQWLHLPCFCRLFTSMISNVCTWTDLSDGVSLLTLFVIVLSQLFALCIKHTQSQHADAHVFRLFFMRGYFYIQFVPCCLTFCVEP